MRHSKVAWLTSFSCTLTYLSELFRIDNCRVSKFIKKGGDQPPNDRNHSCLAIFFLHIPLFEYTEVCYNIHACSIHFQIDICFRLQCLALLTPQTSVLNWICNWFSFHYETMKKKAIQNHNLCMRDSSCSR